MRLKWRTLAEARGAVPALSSDRWSVSVIVASSRLSLIAKTVTRRRRPGNAAARLTLLRRRPSLCRMAAKVPAPRNRNDHGTEPQERNMRRTSHWYLGVAAIAIALALAGPSAQLNAQVPGISIGTSDLGGVVTGAKGPEAGVWVIAETNDLGTKFAKMVVTDDQGRYVLPDLPKARYQVWVRGYGLVDSAKVDSEPGRTLNLRATPAPNAAAAAEYYPAIYWYSMIKVPEKGEFPGTGPQGNGMSTNMKSQAQWLDVVKTNGCYTCHQLGNKATRTIPKEFADMKPEEAWARRIMSGQAQ